MTVPIIEKIRTKFNEQKLKVSVPTKCPYCNEEITFEFEHSQNTSVETRLIKIEKKNA